MQNTYGGVKARILFSNFVFFYMAFHKVPFKLLVKKSGRAKLLVIFERLFPQIVSLDFNNCFEN